MFEMCCHRRDLILRSFHSHLRWSILSIGSVSSSKSFHLSTSSLRVLLFLSCSLAICLKISSICLSSAFTVGWSGPSRCFTWSTPRKWPWIKSRSDDERDSRNGSIVWDAFVICRMYADRPCWKYRVEKTSSIEMSLGIRESKNLLPWKPWKIDLSKTLHHYSPWSAKREKWLDAPFCHRLLTF